MILNESASSVDALAAADSETAVVDMLRQSQNRTQEITLKYLRCALELVSWLQQLPKKQQEIIFRRFRLRGFDADTLENVGVEVGLTRERVKQIQIKALQQLKILILEKG